MKLVLIRHGQTDANLKGALDTAMPGSDLNANGQAQARELVEKWKALIGRAPNILAHSPIARAAQTAAPLAQYYGQETVSMEEFKEISAGNMEMSVTQEDQRTYLYTVVDWSAGKRLEYRLGADESGMDVLRRIDRGVYRLIEKLTQKGVKLDADPEPIIAVVVHGGMMRVWSANRAEGISADLIGQHPPVNTGITVLQKTIKKCEETEGGLWKAILWSDKPLDEYAICPDTAPMTAKDRYRLSAPSDHVQ